MSILQLECPIPIIIFYGTKFKEIMSMWVKMDRQNQRNNVQSQHGSLGDRSYPHHIYTYIYVYSIWAHEKRGGSQLQ